MGALVGPRASAQLARRDLTCSTRADASDVAFSFGASPIQRRGKHGDARRAPLSMETEPAPYIRYDKIHTIKFYNTKTRSTLL